MALADIVKRIEDDAAAEAAVIVDAAEKRAAELLADADRTARAQRDATIAEARAAIDRDAARLVVAEKLSSRDEALTRRRQLVDEALALTAERLAGLPDDRYATFLADRLADVVRGGETVRLGTADQSRREAIAARLSERRPGVSIAEQPAPFERGALVEGDRVRADLSLAAIVEDRRDDLELAIARVLFGEA